MRIVLASLYRKTDDVLMFEEMGICQIAAYLEQFGHEVWPISCDEGEFPFDKVLEFHPQLLGFTLYSYNVGFSANIARQLKQNLPNLKVCGGGFLASYYSRDLLTEYDIIDYGIQYEGELIIKNLVDYLEKGGDLYSIRGLVFKDGNDIIINSREELIKDLDTLPFPNRTILQAQKMSIATLSTSRGCTSACSFCVNKTFWNKKYRCQSTDYVIKEIQEIYDKYNIRHFNFLDCSFDDPTIDRAMQIAQGIIDSNIDITYLTEVRATIYKKLDQKGIQLLKQSGFCGTLIGIESFNEEDLRLYKKQATVEDNINVLNFFKKHDIHYRIGFINFNPYTDYNRLMSNIKYLKQFALGFDLHNLFLHLTIFKSGELYEKIKADGLFDNDTKSDIGMQNYKFIHSYIQQFFEFYWNYIYKRYYNHVVEFYDDRFFYLYFLKNSNPNEMEYEVIQNAIDERYKILRQISDTNCDLFIELLELSKNGFSFDKAVKITNSYLKAEKINAWMNALNLNINLLTKNILRLPNGKSKIRLLG